MNQVDCIQGDATWFANRVGCVTASRVADAIAKLKRSTGESAARRNLRYQFVGERLTGRCAEHFVTEDMQIGIDREPLARAEYEIAADVSVQQVGFVYHPTIKLAGASPDGLVGEDGLVEIKCPRLQTHLEYLIADVVPEDYQPQMLWQMSCCERQWCDFVSYHPDLPDPYRLFVKRFERTAEADAVIRGMELEVIGFLGEVENMLAELRQRVEVLA